MYRNLIKIILAFLLLIFPCVLRIFILKYINNKKISAGGFISPEREIARKSRNFQ